MAVDRRRPSLSITSSTAFRDIQVCNSSSVVPPSSSVPVHGRKPGPCQKSAGHLAALAAIGTAVMLRLAHLRRRDTVRPPDIAATRQLPRAALGRRVQPTFQGRVQTRQAVTVRSNLWPRMSLSKIDQHEEDDGAVT